MNNEIGGTKIELDENNCVVLLTYMSMGSYHTEVYNPMIHGNIDIADKMLANLENNGKTRN